MKLEIFFHLKKRNSLHYTHFYCENLSLRQSQLSCLYWHTSFLYLATLVPLKPRFTLIVPLNLLLVLSLDMARLRKPKEDTDYLYLIPGCICTPHPHFNGLRLTINATENNGS